LNNIPQSLTNCQIDNFFVYGSKKLQVKNLNADSSSVFEALITRHEYARRRDYNSYIVRKYWRAAR